MAIRFHVIALAVGAALLVPFTASADENNCPYKGRTPASSAEWRIYAKHQKERYKKYDINCDGTLSAAERAAEDRDDDSDAAEFVHAVERGQKEGYQITLNKKGETIPPISASGELSPEIKERGIFLLRDSFEDVSIFTRPKSPQKASGASFSWSRDGTIDNSVWSAQGVMSYAYTWPGTAGTPGDPYILGFSLAPAIQFNRSANSSAAKKSKDVDFLGFSATSEIGIADGRGSANYFRVRPNYITDFDGEAKSWSIVAEWQPFLDRQPFRLSQPNDLGPIIWQLDPILRLQYAHQLNGSTDPIFNHNDDPLRIGPVLGLTIQPTGVFNLPKMFQDSTLFASYQYLTDVENGDSSYLLKAGVNFNLDEDGHTALKVSYSKGQLEETGNDIDEVKVGLTAKW